MSRAKGNDAEELGARFLEKLGFKIVERNFYAPFGEIDIIAQKGGVLHFVEVKSRGKERSFEPIYNITPLKLSHIIKSVHFYLKQKRISSPFCIDALILRGNEVELVENITL